MVEIKEIGKTGVDGTYAIEEVADDPFVARFLSPDPFIQSPGNAQNYNRYSYALNNPLKYTDPSGYMYRGAAMGDNPGGFFNHGFKLPQNGTMGSGSHWSDGMMGEYHDFVFFSSKKFNSRYGPQASEIGYYLWSDESRAKKWRNGETSIEQVRKEFEYAGGFWMDFSRVSPVKIKQSKYKGLKIITIKGGIDIVSQWVAIASNSGVSSQGWFTLTGHVNNSIGGFGAGMTTLGGNFRLNNTSGFSPKFYTKPNAAGKIFNGGFGIKTYNTANWGRGIGYGSLAISVTFGGIYVADAWQQDGNTYGANTQMAIAQTSLGVTGAWAGAEIGAAVGVWFGGVGAIPGAVIGGVIGGVVGGWGGSMLGETVVNNFSSY